MGQKAFFFCGIATIARKRSFMLTQFTIESTFFLFLFGIHSSSPYGCRSWLRQWREESFFVCMNNRLGSSLTFSSHWFAPCFVAPFPPLTAPKNTPLVVMLTYHLLTSLSQRASKLVSLVPLPMMQIDFLTGILFW